MYGVFIKWNLKQNVGYNILDLFSISEYGLFAILQKCLNYKNLIFIYFINVC